MIPNYIVASFLIGMVIAPVRGIQYSFIFWLLSYSLLYILIALIKREKKWEEEEAAPVRVVGNF